MTACVNCVISRNDTLLGESNSCPLCVIECTSGNLQKVTHTQTHTQTCTTACLIHRVTVDSVEPTIILDSSLPTIPVMAFGNVKGRVQNPCVINRVNYSKTLTS